MNRLAKLPLEERTVYFAQAAARLALPAAAVEKDFWVCWTLARLFSSERLAPRILFKGGTSLSPSLQGTGHLVDRTLQGIVQIPNHKEE